MPAEEETSAPAEDNADDAEITSPKTGNTSASALVCVTAIAAAAALAAKRK